MNLDNEGINNSTDPLKHFQKKLKSSLQIILITLFGSYNLPIIKVFILPTSFIIKTLTILIIILPFPIFILKFIVQLLKNNSENLKKQKYRICKYTNIFSKIALICFILAIIIFIYISITGILFNVLESLDFYILILQFACAAGFFESLNDIASAIEDFKKN